jgi:hypothetical protein
MVGVHRATGHASPAGYERPVENGSALRTRCGAGQTGCLATSTHAGRGLGPADSRRTSPDTLVTSHRDLAQTPWPNPTSGHGAGRRRRCRGWRSYASPSGRVLQPNRARTVLGAQALRLARRCVTQGSRATRQSLRCTTRVTRCRTRLICQRHRGSTRPGPRPRPASSGAPAHTAIYWLIHCLVDASPWGAAASAWSAL